MDYGNISVYTFSEKEIGDKPSFEIENVDHSEKRTLELIGARASSVFLTNCTIWVEGITDRLYLRKYLEIYQKDKHKKYKEDYHFSFVEYGGNNITHWSFLDSDDEHSNIDVEKLCSKLFLLTDHDGAGLKKDGTENRAKSKKYNRHKQLKSKLGERYYCLECREIENLLSKETIKRTITAMEGSHLNFDFSDFDRRDHSSVPLGNYLRDNVASLTRNYAAASGTIHNKVVFCKKAISEIKTIDDLSDEALTLSKKLYNFIESNNS